MKKNSIWYKDDGVFLIAEIGGNHEGDFQYAKRLVQLAIEARVDAIKFQVYTADALVNKKESPARHRHFKNFELTKNQHITLAKMCIENKINYAASVWDVEALNWLDDYISIYKIGSGDLTAYPIIKAIVEKSKPVVLSTGMSTLKEVKDTVAYIKSIDSSYITDNRLALLQCTAAYPTPDNNVNLKAIVTLKEETGLVVGYSDHTIGSRALEIAVTLGAQILEFHFTDTRAGKQFRDHNISLTKEDVKELKRAIIEIKSLLGDGAKLVMPSERGNRKTFRRAIYPARSLPKGSILTQDKLVCLRPNCGIDARDYDKIINRRVRKRLAKYEKIREDFLG